MTSCSARKAKTFRTTRGSPGSLPLLERLPEERGETYAQLYGSDPAEMEEAARRVKASATVRLLGQALVCVVLIAIFKTNVYATLLPLLFPRIGLMFRPLIDRKRGTEPSGTEGSDLID